MNWQEFNQVFDFTIFDKLIQDLNDESLKKYEEYNKKKKPQPRRYNYQPVYVPDWNAFELLPFEVIENKHVIKYRKSSKTKSNVEECILGYFQEFEKGWAFISIDSSHMWKKLREMINETQPKLENLIIGSNMLFCKLAEIDFDTRYYFLKEDGIDDTSFFFKSSCVRINDVYVGSNKSHRYFLILDFAYTSSDFTTNNYISSETFFEHLKELNNEDILVVFDQRRDLKNYQEVMQRYSDKMIKKLLKI